jgi:hypothetical protein
VLQAADADGKVFVSSPTTAIGRKVLHSWKEIALYMRLGVRTVQRYEQHLGLPIRRFGGVARTSVTAFTDELDTWMVTAGTHTIGRAEWERAMSEIEELRGEVENLRKLTEEVCRKIDSRENIERTCHPKLEDRASRLSSSS